MQYKSTVNGVSEIIAKRNNVRTENLENSNSRQIETKMKAETKEGKQPGRFAPCVPPLSFLFSSPFQFAANLNFEISRIADSRNFVSTEFVSRLFGVCTQIKTISVDCQSKLS